MKKFFSTLLALIMLISCMTGLMTASAEDVVAYDGSEVHLLLPTI